MVPAAAGDDRHDPKFRGAARVDLSKMRGVLVAKPEGVSVLSAALQDGDDIDMTPEETIKAYKTLVDGAVWIDRRMDRRHRRVVWRRRAQARSAQD